MIRTFGSGTVIAGPKTPGAAPNDGTIAQETWRHPRGLGHADPGPVGTGGQSGRLDKSIDVVSEDAPIVRLCNRIIIEAVKMRASDIHIEPMADRVRLRYRIDGVCMERDNLPKRMQNSC
jgi:hypothetical protein